MCERAPIEFVADAHTRIEAWRLDYNHRRPHNSLGLLTPNEFVRQRKVARVDEKAYSRSYTCADKPSNIVVVFADEGGA